jgi:AraC-like DNA-binding protein
VKADFGGKSMLQASLRGADVPPPPALSSGADSFEDGLTITTSLDSGSVAELVRTISDDSLLLLIASDPETPKFLLVVARPAQLATLWTKELRGILLCAAERTWLDAQVEATDRPLRPGSRLITGKFFLGAHAARLASSMTDLPMAGRVGEVYRMAKSRELFCVAVYDYLASRLIPASGEHCSAEDSRRLLEAQRLIATRFSEKLTLSAIGRACGLNRTKLTRGFRELFNRSVAAALSDARLKWAAEELRSGGMSVSQIAYAAGYLSHASFTRAFSRHYGVAPKAWRKKVESRPSVVFSLC